MNDEQQLRTAYDELVAARQSAGRTACPPAEALLDVVERRGDEDARLATMDHVMQCAACRAELELLRAAVVAAHEAAPGEAVAGSIGAGGRRFPMRALAAAAGIVFVVGVGVIAYDGSRDPDTPRSRGERPALALAAPVRGVDGSIALAWQRWPDAVQYRVDVFDAAGNAVAGGVVRDTTFTIPATALRGDVRALRYVVTAVQGDAVEVTSITAPVAP